MVESAPHQRLLPNSAHIPGPASVRVEGDLAWATGYSRVELWKDGAFHPWRVSANHWSFERRDGRWQVLRAGDEGKHQVFSPWRGHPHVARTNVEFPCFPVTIQGSNALEYAPPADGSGGDCCCTSATSCTRATRFLASAARTRSPTRWWR